MMKYHNGILVLITILGVIGLTGCSSDLSERYSSTGNSGGVAVDPYIVGAKFQEIAADGETVLQRESTPTDENGVFVFPKPLTEGSTVELKIGSKGLHEGAPFEGMLRRKVSSGQTGSMVVSPLTTLLANGFSEDEVVGVLSAAGLELSADDLYSDPMQKFDDQSGQISDENLTPLHANMAVNQFMTTIEKFDVNQTVLDDYENFQLLSSLVKANQDLLNESEFARIQTELGSQIGASAPLLPSELLTSVVRTMRTVVAQAQEMHTNGTLDAENIGQKVNAAQQGAVQEILALYLDRVGQQTPPATVDGQSIFTAECAGCHNVGSGGLMDLAGKGTMVIEKIAAQHKAKILNADQVQALVAYVDSMNETPVPDPDPTPVPVDGQALYEAQCSGCHKLGEYDLTGSAPELAGADGLVAGKLNAGHRSIVLTTDEVTALAEWVAQNPAVITPDPQPTPDPNPTPDGVALYESECQGCHGPLTSNNVQNRTFTGIQQAIDANLGGMGMLTLSVAEIQAISDSMPLPDPTPAPDPTPVDGQTLYDGNCAGCHILGDYDSAGSAPDLGGQGNLVTSTIEAGHKSISLTADELSALASWANANPAPVVVPDPVPAPVDGQALYDDNCAGCHIMGDYDTAGSAPELGGQGNLVISKLEAGHKSISLTADELNALADWADANPAPVVVPDPTPVPVDGQALYDGNCAGCHILGDYDSAGYAPELGGQGNLVISTIEAGHQSISLTAEELNALADWSDANPAPVVIPDPTPVPVDGQALYDDNCAGCHSVNTYDASGAPDLASAGDLVPAKLAAGHKGFVLTTEEEVALADFLNQYQAASSGPDYSDCTLCHAQPPNGEFFPNEAGAHAVHAALSGVGTDCSACHIGASHDDVVEVAFAASFNAKSGPATDNGDGTCSAVSCHGGQTTPDWYSGSLSVNTQCASCHIRSTSEYNGYYSGEHSKHRGYDCTVCHNTDKLATNHFGDLSTSGFEFSPATTIGGGSTRVGSYSGGTCSSIQCHGSESW